MSDTPEPSYREAQAVGTRPPPLSVPRWQWALILALCSAVFGAIMLAAAYDSYTPSIGVVLAAWVLVGLSGALALAGIVGWVIEGVLRDQARD